MSTRCSSPASRTRSRARACCSAEIVIEVTRQPSSPAAYSAKPPQPDPISRTCIPAARPAPSASRRYLFRWASASDCSGDANTALE